jgi:uncharacterized protein YozE (UPF0346 family)
MTEDVFYIMTGDDLFFPDRDFNSAVELIKAQNKKFTTVVVKKQLPPIKAAKTSSLIPEASICHNAYKIAFDTQLVGNVGDDKMRLIAAIQDVNKNVSKHKLYSPSIPICQGSGSGKTKLACSLDSELPCAYVVFREKDAMAYPEKSSLGDLFLNCPVSLNENSFNCDSLSVTNIGTYVHLIFAIVSDYHHRVLTLKSELSISGKISSEKSKRIRRQILQECVEGNFFGPELENFNQMKRLELLSSAGFDTVSYEIQKICKKISEELNLPLESSPLVITLDEVNLLSVDIKKTSAYSLKNLLKASTENEPVMTRLRLLRRAMHALGSKSNVVFLTLGTKTDYTDMDPTFGVDSMRDDRRSRFYPLFIISRNTDIFYSHISKLPISASMLKDPRMVLVRFSMGRPLWCSLAISDVLRIAEIKLANSSIKTGEALVACWMLRTGIPASPHMIDSSRHLVKSNMATLLDIHPTLPLMYVSYPSEPVLAMAAQTLVNRNMVNYFKILRNYLVCKGFDRGDLAETLAAEICLQAVYKAKRVESCPSYPCEELNSLEISNSKKFILESQLDSGTLESKLKKIRVRDCSVIPVAQDCMKLTTLENFLEVLYGNHYESLDLENCISPRMLKGIVDFNHFIRLNDGFPLEDFFGKEDIDFIRKNKLPLINGRNSKKRYHCRGFNQLGLKRGAAFFMPESHPGSDLLIPICLEDEEEVSLSHAKDTSTNKSSGKLSYAETISVNNPAPTAESQSPKLRKRKATLAMMSIQVKAGSLNSKEKSECAEKLFIDHKFTKCTKNENCQGCDYCETEENYDFMMKNQLALVFTFGPGETGKPPIEKKVLTGNGQNAPSSSKLTIIFNNGPDYLKNIWDSDFDEINEIVKDTIAFSWLPHNFIDSKGGTGPYHLNQILEAYLDKPLFPEFSDIFRDELGWPEIKNPKRKKEVYQKLIAEMLANSNSNSK